MPRIVALLRTVDRVLFGPLREQHLRILEREIVGTCETLLDVGCGATSPIQRFSKRLRHSVGVDSFEPYLERSRAAGIHSEYRLVDALQIEQHFAPRSFDCVLASELAEHLPKQDGLRLMHMMEKIAKRKVIIVTTNGFLPQGGCDDNVRQAHLCGWSVAEMRDLGYRVIGIHGWKPLRGAYGLPRWRPYALWDRISLLSQVLAKRCPTCAFEMLCVKDINPE